MDLSSLIACHECDLLHHRKEIAARTAAKCSRCGAQLYRRPADSLDRSLAFTLTAAVLFVVANLYPFLYFELQGRVEANTILTGVLRLSDWGYWHVAGLVLFVSVLAPGAKILASLYVLLAVKTKRTPWKLAQVFRFQRAVAPWGMLEVYMLGVLIAIVNLLALADIALGVAFWAFVALMLTTTAASSHLDPDLVWRQLEARR